MTKEEKKAFDLLSTENTDLKAQLYEKDTALQAALENADEALKAEVEEKDKQIANLEALVSDQSATLAELQHHIDKGASGVSTDKKEPVEVDGIAYTFEKKKFRIAPDSTLYVAEEVRTNLEVLERILKIHGQKILVPVTA